MAVEDIVNYIEENKTEHSVQELIGEIRKSGYPDSEILGAIEILKQRRASGVDGATKLNDTNDRPVSELSTGKKVLATIGGFLLLPFLLYLFMFLSDFLPLYYLFSFFGYGYGEIFGYLLIPIVLIVTIYFFLNRSATGKKYSKPLSNGLRIFFILGFLLVALFLFSFGAFRF